MNLRVWVEGEWERGMWRYVKRRMGGGGGGGQREKHLHREILIA